MTYTVCGDVDCNYPGCSSACPGRNKLRQFTTTSNNPPDVVLELTHEEATFMIENCKANMHLGLQMVLSFQHAPGTLEEKREKAQKYIDLQDKFRVLLTKVRKAGGKDND